MEERLKKFIDEAFSNAPDTKNTQDVKDEMYLNLLEKYNDELKNGKSEEEAYRTVIASVGDLSELIMELKAQDEQNKNEETEEDEENKIKRTMFVALGVGGYIISIIPVIIFGHFKLDFIGISLMFLFCAISTGLLIYSGSYSGTAKKKPKDDEALKNSLLGLYWSVVVIAYLLVSFLTHKWAFTWIIFLIGALVENVIKLIINRKNKD